MTERGGQATDRLERLADSSYHMARKLLHPPTLFILFSFYCFIAYGTLAHAFTQASGGLILAHPDNTDQWFHEWHVREPFLFLEQLINGGSFYPPGFHLLAGVYARMTGKNAVATLNLISPAIVFLLFPYCLLAFAKEYFQRMPETIYRSLGSREALAGVAGFMAVAFSTFQLFSILVYTIPHIIGTSIILIGLRPLLELCRGGGGRTLARIWPYLLLLALIHTPSFVYYLVLVTVALWLAGWRRIVVPAAVLALPLVFLTPLGGRVTSYVVWALQRSLPFLWYPRNVWWNLPFNLTPPALFFGGHGLLWMKKAGWRREDWLLLAAAAMPLLFCWVDPNYRTLHNVAVMLCVPAAASFTVFWRHGWAGRVFAVGVLASALLIQFVLLAGTVMLASGFFEQLGV